MVTKTLSCWILLISLGCVACGDIELNGHCKFKQFDGTCQLFSSCKMALNIFRIRDYATLKDMFCGYHSKNQPKVCCPKGDKVNNDFLTIESQQQPASITFRDEFDTKYEHKETIVYTTPDARPIHNMFPSSTRQPATAPPPTAPTALPAHPVQTSTNNVLPGRNVCGLINERSRIFGGSITAIDEFPWLARINLYNRIVNKTMYACTGSLINERYVLTAAHCVSTYNIVHVRLGEWDSETELDCQEDDCADHPVDIEVDDIKTPPGYSRGYDKDIALLRLKHPVNFTDFVRPICLPTTKYVAKQDYIDSTYWTAGWGITEFGEQSVIKRKVALDAVPYNTCRAAIPSLPDTYPPSVICAGGTKGQDTCRGDSGGSLARIVAEDYQQNWYLYGITSYGVKQCGTLGKPGVYTRVSIYMDWILDTIASG